MTPSCATRPQAEAQKAVLNALKKENDETFEASRDAKAVAQHKAARAAALFDFSTLALVHCNFGRVKMQLPDTTGARKSLEEAKELAEKVGDQRLVKECNLLLEHKDLSC